MGELKDQSKPKIHGTRHTSTPMFVGLGRCPESGVRGHTFAGSNLQSATNRPASPLPYATNTTDDWGRISTDEE